MRILRWLIAAASAAVLLTPTPALANGGSYIELNGTHFLPGETAVAEAYLSVPKARRELLEQGPFYAYVLPGGAQLREGRPVPSGAIRVGTFEIEHDEGISFEARAAFTVPFLPGDFYSIGLCNDPCTISGFGEPVGGTISIVETAREGELLTDRSRLQSRTYALRRQVRRADRQNDELASQVAQLQDAQNQVVELTAEITALEEQLRDARAEASIDSEPSMIARPGLSIAIGIAAVAMTLFVLRRRRTRPGHETA